MLVIRQIFEFNDHRIPAPGPPGRVIRRARRLIEHDRDTTGIEVVSAGSRGRRVLYSVAASDLRRPFWVSWYAVGAFELSSPWWISGKRGDGVDTICAAVMARDEADAKHIIDLAHEGAGPTEWRFCTEKPAGWAPFGERFPRADWMEWPRAGGNVRWTTVSNVRWTKDPRASGPDLAPRESITGESTYSVTWPESGAAKMFEEARRVAEEEMARSFARRSDEVGTTMHDAAKGNVVAVLLDGPAGGDPC